MNHCKICGKEIPEGKELCDECEVRNIKIY